MSIPRRVKHAFTILSMLENLQEEMSKENKEQRLQLEVCEVSIRDLEEKCDELTLHIRELQEEVKKKDSEIGNLGEEVKNRNLKIGDL
jgi:peptidoglycan hydrolase CwlO-like protein